MTDERWDEALKEAMEWQADEPLSGRPATAVSYLAIIVGNPSVAAMSAQTGLRANGDDQLLRNNLSVAYARMARHAEAQAEFNKIRGPLQRGFPRYVSDATKGLMAYIGGNLELGRELYQLALRGAPMGDRAIVALSFVETEWDFVPQARASMREEMKKIVDKIAVPAARVVARRLVQTPLEAAHAESGTTKLVSAQEYARTLLVGDEHRANRVVDAAPIFPAARDKRR